ncbi:hypothetical protein MKX01_014084 [Papaver californicum]|nr:hypothetical protein MKX01_014084 [Papaver californicum]
MLLQIQILKVSLYDKVEEMITNNWKELKDVVFGSSSLSKPSLLMWEELRAGEKKKVTAGACERLHSAMHKWVGPVEKPHHDMGNFHTATNDTLFLAHHANVDRMWDIYRNLIKRDYEFHDDDWLDSSFIFADVGDDGKPQVVKFKVRASF